MDISTVGESPLNERGGQKSYLLLRKGQFGTANLSMSWVDCAPGSVQPLHQHETSEQAYIIVRGRGVMIVGDEEREVGEGTLISIPMRTPHAIRNETDAPLTYVSATSPPFEDASLPAEFAYRKQT